MRKSVIFVFIFLVGVWGCSPQPPKTEEQKAFYALGAHLNKQLSVFDMSPEEMKYVQMGMSDASAGKKLVAEPEANMPKLAEMIQSRMAKATEKQKAQSKAFLEKAAAEKRREKNPNRSDLQRDKNWNRCTAESYGHCKSPLRR